jgi:hypothetical protein
MGGHRAQHAALSPHQQFQADLLLALPDQLVCYFGVVQSGLWCTGARSRAHHPQTLLGRFARDWPGSAYQSIFWSNEIADYGFEPRDMFTDSKGLPGHAASSFLLNFS